MGTKLLRTMSVNYYLAPKANKAGEFPIRVSINIKKTRYLTTIGFNVSAEAWVANNPNASKRKSSNFVVGKYTNNNGMPSERMNFILKKVDAHFTEYENDLKGKRPTVEELREEFQKAIRLGEELEVIEVPTVKEPTLFERLEEFKVEQGAVSQWAYATKQCWKTFTRHLTKFNKRVKFEYFDEAGLNKFIRHLRSTEKLEEKTVQKQYTMLKWFITWALRKGYTKQDYINRYKVKFKVLQKPVIFLTKEELLKVYNYKIPENQTEVTLYKYNGEEYKKKVVEAGAIAKTRDLFCFCAFTSLRYSDMAQVKRSDIVDGILYITTQKTNDRLPINLNSFAQAILDKYKDCKFPGDLALPVISNQKMNYYLKDLCEFCGINDPITQVFYRAGERVEETYPKYELIGTHAGRRTFICFALSSGISPQIVMKWTGHSDYKAMKPYIDIAEKTKAEAMDVFDKGLKG